MTYVSTHHLSPEIQAILAQLETERAAVPESEIDQVLHAWALATDAYCKAGFVAVGHLIGEGRWLQYRRPGPGKEELLSLNVSQHTFTELGARDLKVLRQAIRAGELEISVYRRFWSGSQHTGPLMKLYLSSGRFRPFNYTFKFPLNGV